MLASAARQDIVTEYNGDADNLNTVPRMHTSYVANISKKMLRKQGGRLCCVCTYVRRAHNSSPSPDKTVQCQDKNSQFWIYSNTFPNYNFKMSGQFSNVVVSTVYICTYMLCLVL